LLRPDSRGYITLRSADPFATPAIHPHYLEHEDDINGLIAGIKLARSFAQTGAFAPWQLRESHPGTPAASREALIEYLRANLKTLYHPVGTCKMGHDTQAVVDDHLRVRGVSGLRVIDASIMPTIISGNTNAPTMMIAEKGADLILQDERQAIYA
jgi:choline dehydrogenase